MNEAEDRPRRRAQPKRAPSPLVVGLRRADATAARPFRAAWKRFRTAQRRGYRGVERPPRWARPRWMMSLRRIAARAAALVLVLLIARAVYIVVGGDNHAVPFGLNPDDDCRQYNYSCGVLSGIAMTFLTLGFGTTAFLIYRMRRVRQPFVKRARDETRELVPTAGTIIGEVVGRDEVCHVIMDDLRERGSRRPHLVLGGVGVGKTAVLFRLTQLLAENGAVPVPIRLREASEDLDFHDLARERFIKEVANASISDTELDLVWRRLRAEDRIVVLADGLEEALSGARRNGGVAAWGREEQERDNRIRLAVRAAHRAQVPLVIASRPHDAIVALDAAVVELEDLGEEAALEYIEHGASTRDSYRLDWVIETAEVTETPLFLQIAHELHEQQLLEHAHERPGKRRLDTRNVDRASLRVRLLETWTEGLVDGYFASDLPMSSRFREATVDQLGGLACMGLRDDTLEVSFTQLFERVPDHRAGAAEGATRYRYEAVMERLKRLVRAANEDAVPGSGKLDIDVEREVRLAATRGLQLRLVEPFGDGVRFPHSILQAYLGSRVIGDVIAGPEPDAAFMPAALRNAGRELLVALAMYSRSASPPSEAVLREICRRLQDAAGDTALSTAKRIDTAVAAMEIDAATADPRHAEIARLLASPAVWPAAQEDRTVEEAKLKAVSRFGESARTVAKRGGTPAYRELFEIGARDLSYRVRLAVAQELGAGGDAAFAALRGLDRVRVGASDYLAPPVGREWQSEDRHRAFTMRAWLAPLLFGSTERWEAAARANLQRWLQEVGPEADRVDRRFPLSLEVALGQGFKHAANRRSSHPYARAGARFYLAEQAAEMLADARFWFSRVTLVHALCLWAMPDAPIDPEPRTPERRRAGRRPAPARDRRPAKEPRRRASDPRALVGHWLESASSEPEHPFVDEARKLAVLALEKRSPERYLWIDESGVTTKIGARPSRPDAVRKHQLWIPPSVGWSSLDPRAQKLVADVLLMLNLIERDGDPVARERRMRRATRDDLPPCLTGERENLNPEQTVGMVEQLAPGASCKDGCMFDLCPYPPKGKQPYRVELSEAFCRRQQVLLGRWWQLVPRRTARWQGAMPRDLRRFWRTMETRARR